MRQRLSVLDASRFASFWTRSYWDGVYANDGLFRPWALSLLGLQKLLWGESLFAYRIVNLCLHGFCAIQVAYLLSHYLKPGAAFFGGLLFAVHPVHAEDVITIFGKVDLWAALFALSAWSLAQKSRLSAGMVPSGESGAGFDCALAVRPNLVLVTLGESLRLLVYPVGQTTYYGHLRDDLFQLLSPRHLLYVLLFLGYLRLLVWKLGSQPVLVFAFWILVFLFPVLNVFSIGTVVAERTLYLPSIGFCGIMALSGEMLPSGRLGAKRTMAAVILVLCGLACFNVSRQWRSMKTHWEYTIGSHPRSPKAHATVALIYATEVIREDAEGDDPRVAIARQNADRALALNPNNVSARQASEVIKIIERNRHHHHETLQEIAEEWTPLRLPKGSNAQDKDRRGIFILCV